MASTRMTSTDLTQLASIDLTWLASTVGIENDPDDIDCGPDNSAGIHYNSGNSNGTDYDSGNSNGIDYV
jgi:hypothetical protein